MELMQQKEKLIGRGNQLLAFVKEKDFGWDIIKNVMDDQHIEELKDWLQDVEEFIEKFGLECQNERFRSIPWIINQDERVNVEGIKDILSIIGRIDCVEQR